MVSGSLIVQVRRTLGAREREHLGQSNPATRTTTPDQCRSSRVRFIAGPERRHAICKTEVGATIRRSRAHTCGLRPLDTIKAGRRPWSRLKAQRACNTLAVHVITTTHSVRGARLVLALSGVAHHRLRNLAPGTLQYTHAVCECTCMKREGLRQTPSSLTSRRSTPFGDPRKDLLRRRRQASWSMCLCARSRMRRAVNER